MPERMPALASVSKTTPPRLPRVLRRPRLIEDLEKNKKRKLTLIIGQAAQGKSTLAASYVNQSEIPSAWMNLDMADSDPANLFGVLVQSLQSAATECDLSAVFDYPGRTAGPRNELSLYTEWLEAVFKQVPATVQIVLDGLDRLSSDAPSFRFLEVLIDEAPPHIRLIMVSRDMPPFEIQRLKMRQELGIVDNDELAFTLDETRTFFRDVRSMPFTVKQIERIHELTEGWTGGLILLSEKLEHIPEARRKEYFFDGMPARLAGEVFQYFGDEILFSQPPSVREFLIKSSMFDVVEPTFVKDFLKTENPEEILHDLARRNLFVQPVYDKSRGWLFRYHQLFGDFLGSRFRAETGEEERQSLYLKAGSLYEQRGDLENAVKYYLEAGAYSQAAVAIEQVGVVLVRLGRTQDLARWLKALPEEMVEENPWLLLCLSMSRRLTGLTENVFSLKKALELFEERGDERGQMLSLAFFIETSILRGRHLVPVRDLLEKADTLLESVQPERYPYESAILWFAAGFGHLPSGGDMRKCFSSCQNAYLIAKTLGDTALQVNALSYSIAALSYLGEFGAGEELCGKLEALIEKNPSVDLKCVQLCARGEWALYSGDYDLAARLFESLDHEINEHGLVHMVPHSLGWKIIYKVHTNQHEEAGQVAARLKALSTSMGHYHGMGTAGLLGGLCSYAKGDYEEAKSQLSNSAAIFSSDECNAVFHVNVINLITGLTYTQLGEDRQAEEAFRDALAYFTSAGSAVFSMDCHLGMGLLEWKQGKTAESVAHLRTGFKIAQERGYNHFLILSNGDAVAACTLALELQVEGAMDYAANLLRTRLAPYAGPELDRLARHKKPKIRKKAGEIKKAIHRSNVPRLRIQTLGEFQVLRDDMPVEAKAWQGSQPRSLLKAIIARGSGGVSNEILVEDLWTEGSPGTGEKSLKTTLHRLRKALEPEMDKAFGSSYVHLKKKAISLDKECCQIDVNEFLSFCEKGKKMEASGNAKEALPLYEKAVDLYKGDFLPEEPYAPWAAKKRRELRMTYIDALKRTAALHESRGAYKKAIDCYGKVIEADPLLEEAYQRLMTLYADRGMKSAALKLYEECKRTLKDELDAEPSPVTAAIHAKIIETP